MSMFTSEKIRSYSRILASVLLGTGFLLGTARTANCLEVSSGETAELERLHQAKQYERAVARGFPVYRRLVRQKITGKGVEDYGFRRDVELPGYDLGVLFILVNAVAGHNQADGIDREGPLA